MANQEHGADDALVEAVARAITPIIEGDGEIYWAQEYGRPLPVDSAKNISRAAITAYRQQERPTPERLAVEPVAWMYEWGLSRVVKDCRQPHFTGYTEYPLYTAEAIQAAIAAERERVFAVVTEFEQKARDHGVGCAREAYRKVLRYLDSQPVGDKQ